MKVNEDGNELTFSLSEFKELNYLNEGLTKLRIWLRDRMESYVIPELEGAANAYLSIQVVDDDEYKSIEGLEL